MKFITIQRKTVAWGELSDLLFIGNHIVICRSRVRFKLILEIF